MKFWFCETCGKRLSDKDLEEGSARNKKLKGVFCKECSVGVMTMEMDAINIEELAKARPEQISSAKATPSYGTKRSEARTQPARSQNRTGEGPNSRVAAQGSADARANAKSPAQPILVGLAVAGVITVLAWAILASGEKTPPAADPSGIASTRQAEVTPSARKNPEPPAVAPKALPATPTLPEPKKTEPVPELVPMPDSEIQAKADYEKMVKQVASMEAPPAERLAVIDVFLKDHAGSEFAQKARTLKDGIVSLDSLRDLLPPKTPALVPDIEPVAPPAAAVPTVPPPTEQAPFPPIFNPEQQEVRSLFERISTALNKGAIEEAIALSKAGKVPVSRHMLSSLERSQKLRQAAVDNLRKSPPSTEMKFMWNKLEIKGKLARIDGNRAWIKSEGMEIPLEFDAIPHDYLLSAMNLNGQDAKSLADNATMLFSWGDFEQANAILKKLGPDSPDDLQKVFTEWQALKRRKEFEDTVAAVESAITKGQKSSALSLVDKLIHGYPELTSEQKLRIDSLSDSAKNAGMAKMLAQKAFKGEIVRVDDDFSVELRYNFAKNPQGLSDFTGNNLKTAAGGLPVSGVGGKYAEAEGVCHVAHFQPKSLSVEYVIESGCFDVFFSRIGYVQFMVRWADSPGQIGISYEPKYSWGGNSKSWNHPPNSGTHRHVFERTPQTVRFLMDGTEGAKEAVPRPTSAAAKAAKPETTWTIGIVPYRDCTINEIIIKGTLDQVWLKQMTGSE